MSEARYRTLAARTSRLYALSAGLSEAVTLDAVAKVTVHHGKVVAGASASSVALLVEGGTQFETLGGEEPDALAIDSPRVFPAEPGLCATAAVEKQGRIVRPNTRPGLGIEINEAEVKKHPFEQEILQRVNHPDGSVGDW